MILKVQRNEKCWTYFDNIARVKVYSGVEEDIGGSEGNQAEVQYRVTGDLIGWIIPRPLIARGKTTMVKDGVVIGLRACHSICKDGTEFDIVFDTQAYLLNDEGKTIEKL